MTAAAAAAAPPQSGSTPLLHWLIVVSIGLAIATLIVPILWPILQILSFYILPWILTYLSAVPYIMNTFQTSPYVMAAMLPIWALSAVSHANIWKSILFGSTSYGWFKVLALWNSCVLLGVQWLCFDNIIGKAGA